MSYNYQRERDEAIVLLSAEGLPLDTIRSLFRLSQTLHRLAVAQCNGDWPADNGERKTVVCPACECCWHPSSMKRCPSLARRHDDDARPGIKYCPDCRATEAVKRLLDDTRTGFLAVMQGDPRGCVLKVRVPSGKTNDWAKEGICIPVRER